MFPAVNEACTHARTHVRNSANKRFSLVVQRLFCKHILCVNCEYIQCNQYMQTSLQVNPGQHVVIQQWD